MLLAYTRAVSPTLADCELTHLRREPLDVALAAAEHEAYVRLLLHLGVTVRHFPLAPDLPDAVFVGAEAKAESGVTCCCLLLRT